MELKDQVTPLELAKKLHKLGLKERSIASWYTGDSNLGPMVFFTLPGEPKENHYAAFTASELGELLPTQSGIISWDVSYNDHQGQWDCRIYDLVKYFQTESVSPIPPIAYEAEGETMAEAMADALIHCIENKLVTP